jgi:hypothetical protein
MNVKLVGIALLAIIGLTVLLFIWWPIRVQTYVLSSKMKPGWVIIEYENPKCQPLRKTLVGQEFVIPESGYMCTSSPIYIGWFREEYYLEENGRRTPLKRQLIFRHTTSSILADEEKCQTKYESFWYGPQDQITNEAINLIKKYHPECRDAGITIHATP